MKNKFWQAKCFRILSFLLHILRRCNKLAWWNSSSRLLSTCGGIIEKTDGLCRPNNVKTKRVSRDVVLMSLLLALNLISISFTNLLQLFPNLSTDFSLRLTLANVFIELHQRFDNWHCGSGCGAIIQSTGKHP